MKITFRSLALTAAALATAQLPAATSLNVPAAKSRVDALFTQHYGETESLYRDLHAHPELAFQETRTAARLAREMRALGFEVTEGVGGTGLVAILHNGKGPTAMVRTELDALPVQEESGLPYASHDHQPFSGAESPTMHACGHDIHMAAWVATARTLVAMKDRWHGTLMFIAQPAEERVSGARAMLDDGLFQRFPRPDVGFALHTMPEAYDEVLYRSGPMTSNGSGLVVHFHGRGGHGSDPSRTIDPVMMAARFVVDVQSVVSREKDPGAFGVVTIGAIQGGSAGNVIPDSVEVRGTVRSLSDEVHEKLFDGVRRTANAVAAMAGAPPPEVTLGGGVKSVINDGAVTARTAALFSQAFGDKARVMDTAWTGGEDYSVFVAAGVPSLYFGIGIYGPERMAKARAGGEPPPANHSPKYVPDDPRATLHTGVLAMSLALLGALQ
ncbi:MAG: amidohydrolase [Steroidobacteraceae bacterium]